jgi:hypothetical protein
MNEIKKRLIRLWVLLMIAAAIAALALWDAKRKEAQTKRQQAQAKLLRIADPNEVASLKITHGDKTFEIVRDDAADELHRYIIVAPIKALAEQTTIAGMLQFLAEMKSDAWVGEKVSKDSHATTPPGDLTLFGLQPPQYTIEIKTKDGAQQTLLVGKKNNFNDSIYAKRADSNEIALTASSLAYQLDKDIYDLREKRIVLFTPDAVQKLIIHRGAESLTLQREADGFHLTAPQTFLADKIHVDALLMALADARALEFVAEPATAADLIQVGLDKPSIRAEIYLKDPKPLVLYLAKGPHDNEFFATNQDKNIVIRLAVSGVYEKLSTPLSDLRDKHILKFERDNIGSIEMQKGDKIVRFERKKDSWTMTKPEIAPASEASMNGLLYKLSSLQGEYLLADNIGPQDFAAYKLSPPEAQIALFDPQDKPIATLLLAKHGDKEFAAAAAGAKSIYAIRNPTAQEFVFEPNEYKQGELSRH